MKNLRRGFFRIALVLSVVVGLFCAVKCKKIPYEDCRWVSVADTDKYGWGCKRVLREPEWIVPASYFFCYYFWPFIGGSAAVWAVYFGGLYIARGFLGKDQSKRGTP